MTVRLFFLMVFRINEQTLGASQHTVISLKTFSFFLRFRYRPVSIFRTHNLKITLEEEIKFFPFTNIVLKLALSSVTLKFHIYSCVYHALHVVLFRYVLFHCVPFINDKC
jgi:hypothetical protein